MKNPLIKTLERPEKDICIYALLDPFTGLLMYIGQTIQGFKRISEHFHKCDKRNPNGLLSKSKVWISNLKKQNQIFTHEKATLLLFDCWHIFSCFVLLLYKYTRPKCR